MGTGPGETTGTPLPSAVLVTVGDELLLGETVDTNAAWLGRKLAALGVDVRRRLTVGDREDEIREAVGVALGAADLVLVTGGLGPTRDDRTRPAVAALLRRPLRVRPDLLAALERRFRARGYDRLPEPNVTQAEVPEGAEVLRNARGTAPGLAMEHEGALVVLLPGVPAELEAIWEDELEPLLAGRFRERLAPVVHRLLHTAGVSESRLSEIVEGVLPEDLGPVSLAFLPDVAGVDIRLTVRGLPDAEAVRRLDELEARIAPVIARWRFEAPSGDLAEALLARLRDQGRRLAVAESCTGGLVAHRITAVPGASDVLVGGVVAYADRAKTELLGVSPDTIARVGAVSEEVARAMAEGVRARFDAEAGVGVTGIAGPAGGSAEKPVGTVWLGASVGERTEARRVVLPGTRGDIQRRAAQAALLLLLDLLEGRDVEPARPEGTDPPSAPDGGAGERAGP